MSAHSPEAAGKCPLCGKPRDPAFRPFCSKRCADIDLGRWLNGAYAIPAGADIDDDDGAPPLPDPEEG